MAGKSKIDHTELYQLLKQNKTVYEIAEHFDCSPSAVSQARKKLKVDVVRTVGLERAHEVVDQNLDMVQQMQSINHTAHNIVEQLSTSRDLDDRKCVLSACGEIRKQLSLQLDILKSLHNFEESAKFQHEVLQAIGEEAPHVREKIIKRLKQGRALRGAVSIS